MTTSRFALSFATACISVVAAQAHAQSNVTVYGRMDVDIESTKTGSLTQVLVRDNASRFGFRGTEDLGYGQE